MTRQKSASSGAVAGTIVFTDLAGFTEFTDERGDEAALNLLNTKERLVSEAINGKGRIVKNLGDGLMLWFDDACAAIECTLALQERLEEESAVDEDMPLWVRIGVHYGYPTPRGNDYFGHDVNVAKRIVDLAAPGEVLVSEALMLQIGADLSDVMFDEVGPTTMKGIRDPVPLYRAFRL